MKHNMLFHPCSGVVQFIHADHFFVLRIRPNTDLQRCSMAAFIVPDSHRCYLLILQSFVECRRDMPITCVVGRKKMA